MCIRPTRALAALLLALLAGCNLSPIARTETPLAPAPTIAPPVAPVYTPVPTAAPPELPPSLTPAPPERVITPTRPPTATPTEVFVPATILFLGDSITEGWDVHLLYASAVNAGVAGDTTGQILGRYRRQYAGQRFDAVVVLAGINDIAARMDDAYLRDNLLALVSLLRDTGARVVICSLLPVGDYPLEPSQRARIESTNGWLRELAASYGARYADLHAAMVDADGRAVRSYFVDGLHPSRAGYEVMARALADAMR